MRLFHFSDDPGIEVFEPRPVRTPSDRGPGRAWLNGPLVWAIDELRQPMYLFPRDCPRILFWRTPLSTDADVRAIFGRSEARMVAYAEWTWFERIRSEPIHRYELPSDAFESLNDAGMHVARGTVRPISMRTIGDLPAEMAAQGVELRLVERLTPLWGAWELSLHFSGVRLRNARDWSAQAASAVAGTAVSTPP